jgi:hypothetical protein
LLVFLEGVIVNITPPWIRAPLGKRPQVLVIKYNSELTNSFTCVYMKQFTLSVQCCQLLAN